MAISTYHWSLEDWHQLVNSGVLAEKNVELLAGEIINMSPEGIEHSGTSRSVADYLRERLKGIAYISEAHPITLDDSEPEPDIAILSFPENTYLQRHPIAGDIYWLIEVSKGTLEKDLTLKARIYSHNRIPEYWVIDLVNKKVIVHTKPTEQGYGSICECQTGIIKPLAFPEQELDISRLLLY